MFCDIFKIFGKVWLEGFLFTLQPHGIANNILNILTDFSKDHRKTAESKGQVFRMVHVVEVVGQGSIPRPP